MGILELDSICKQYPGFSLSDISFNLPRGFIMGLIGPNGAGKTTTIKIIMNLVRKQSGRVTVFGLDHLDHEVEVKSRIGFVYDIPPFYEHLTIQQMKKIIAPFYPEWNDNLFKKFLADFGLDPRKRIRTLSRGMKMKFALALALSHNAELIIMDEPTSGLDPVFRREFLEILSDFIQNEEKSVLFSTHITTDLERIADFITLIDHGQLVFSSSREDILGRWGVVRGDPKLLERGDESLFSAIHKERFGFEALTEDIPAAKNRFGPAAVIEPASLEDIMVLISRSKAGPKVRDDGRGSR